eukprot:1200670-Amphidinium_carterae.1
MQASMRLHACRRECSTLYLAQSCTSSRGTLPFSCVSLIPSLLNCAFLAVVKLLGPSLVEPSKLRFTSIIKQAVRGSVVVCDGMWEALYPSMAWRVSRVALDAAVLDSPQELDNCKRSACESQGHTAK